MILSGINRENTFLISSISIYVKSRRLTCRLIFITRRYSNPRLTQFPTAVGFTVYLKHGCIIYRTAGPAVPPPFIIIIDTPYSLPLSRALPTHATGNFAERFNDTLIWYSFKRAPSNFTSSPGETLCAIVAASSPVFALDRDFAAEYLQFR